MRGSWESRHPRWPDLGVRQDLSRAVRGASARNTKLHKRVSRTMSSRHPHDVDGQTLPQLLEARAASTPDKFAYFERRGGNRWESTTWSEFLDQARRIQVALLGLGVAPGTRVGLLANNSVTWEACQIAVLACGAVVVGLDVHHVDATLARLIDATSVDLVLAGDESLCERIAALDGARRPQIVALQGTENGTSGRVHSLPSLMALQPDDARRSGLSDRSRPDDLAIVVFSSGTTGNPKPIGYTHRQVLLAIQSITLTYPDVDPDGALLCWLPLANLFQRIIDFCAITRGNPTYVIDDPRTVMEAIAEVKPQLLLGVPRFFERVMNGMRERIAQGPIPVRVIAGWAIARAMNNAAARNHGTVSFLDRAADRLVIQRLRHAFGNQLRYLVSGSAPLSPDLHRFFDAIGLPVFEAYGISECVVPVALNGPGRRKPGTVGQACPGNEVRISPEGEVLVRGPGLFAGYLDDDANHHRLDADGFWHTGDEGQFDDDGFLRLRGRLSDAFKLSTGRWVNPIDVEQRLRSLAWIEQAAAAGEGRKAVVAILDVAPAARPDFELPQAARSRLAAIAASLSGLTDYQQPLGFLIVSERFSINGGELTTNLKLRRRAVAEKYSRELAELYSELETGKLSTGPGQMAAPIVKLL